VGNGSSFGNNYIVLGLGAGYYVVDGLDLGLDVQAGLNIIIGSNSKFFIHCLAP